MVCDRCGKEISEGMENTEYRKTLCQACTKHERNRQQDIDRCVRPDEVSEDLWIWAGRLRTIGNILTCIIIVCGIIFSITSAFITKEASTFYTYSTKSFSWTIFFTTLVTYAISAVAAYFTLRIASLGIDALANIVHNTRAAAELAEYNTRNQ